MKAREVWRFPIEGDFLGSFLGVADGTLLVAFCDRAESTCLTALSIDGLVLWEKRWPDFAYFFCSRNRVFVDGDRARRISPKTGETLNERDLGTSVYAKAAFDAGPVYKIAEGKRHLGLDGETLSILWEEEDQLGDLTFDEGRLCRLNPDWGMAIHELPSLRQLGGSNRALLTDEGAHTHCGNLVCAFGYSSGGRAAVDLETGEVVWRYAEPVGYGLSRFDERRAYSPRDGLTAYDLVTGRELWRRTFSSVVTSRPHLANGRIYVASDDRFVHVLDAETGALFLSEQLAFKRSGTVEPSPVISWGDRGIVVGTRKAIIYLETY